MADFQGADGPLRELALFAGAGGGILGGRLLGWQPTCQCNAGELIPCLVLDPFNGSGTTGEVCIKHGRHYVGCELNQDYIELAKKTIASRGAVLRYAIVRHGNDLAQPPNAARAKPTEFRNGGKCLQVNGLPLSDASV